MSDDKLTLLIMCLQAKLGRFPTEQELLDFINGDHDTREGIWNG